MPATTTELLVDCIGWLLIHSTWQFALIAVFVWLLLATMRRASANARYAALLLGWAAMLATTIVTWWLLPPPSFESAQVVTRAVVQEHREPPAEGTLPHPADDGPQGVVPQGTAGELLGPDGLAPATKPWWSNWQSRASQWLEDLVVAWCLGMFVFALRPAWSWCVTQQLRRNGLSAVTPEIAACMQRASERLRVRQPVQLWQSARVSVPLVVGYLRPVILLPLSATSGLSAADIEAVLAHELAHIRRHDYLINAFQTLMETIFFYHPAVWWLSSAIRREREHCCDELAARALGSRVMYGRALLALEQLRDSSPVLSLGANSGSLLERVRRLAATENGPQSNGVGGLLIAVSLVASITLTGVWSTTGVAEQPAQPEAKSGETALPAGVVAGVTVDSKGQPVPEARVVLRTGGARYTKTDGEGRFRFEDVPPRPRQYLVWASAGNLVTSRVQVEQTVDRDSNTAQFAELRLEMREGHRAQFRVTSAANGQPVPGASVRFGFPDRRHTQTAEDGTAMVEGLLAQQYEVTIEAEGYARDPVQLELSPDLASTEYQAKLKPGGVVRGVVVDKQGDPIPSASVVYRQGSSGVGYYGDSPRADGEGRFQHRFLPLRTPITVSAHHGDFLGQETEIVLLEDKLDLEFKLEPRPQGRSVSGNVLDSTGKPVAGAKVASYGRRSGQTRETVTDSAGAFRLDDLFHLRGDQIHVTADGFAPQKLTLEPEATEGPYQVTIRLEAGHSVHGRIVDESNRPLTGVFISPRSNFYRHELGETYRTAADGRFDFDSLPSNVRFSITHPDYPSLRQTLPLDGDEPVTLKLEAPGVIRGKVVDAESGEPLPQFRIQVGFSRDRQPGDPSGTYDGRWSNPGLTFNSGDGAFVIKPLRAGMPLELRVMAVGYQRLVVPRAVSARPDAIEPLTLGLERLSAEPRYTFTGVLLDHAGQPAAGAQLRLMVSTEPVDANNENQLMWSLKDRFHWGLIKSGQLSSQSYCDQFLSAVSDAEGRFVFNEILPEKHLQLAYWGKGVPQGRSRDFEKSASGGTGSVTIRLPQPATVRGVIDRTKLPDIGSVRLTLDEASFHSYELQLADKQSEFTFTDLPPGGYSAIAYAKPVEFTENGSTFFRVSPVANLPVQVEPGTTVELRFTESNVENR